MTMANDKEMTLSSLRISYQSLAHTANVYIQTTDELIFKSVISTQRYLSKVIVT